MWTNISKPNTSAYTNISHSTTIQTYDGLIAYDDVSTDYDGATINWNNINKPSNSWTNINKPT